MTQRLDEQVLQLEWDSGYRCIEQLVSCQLMKIIEHQEVDEMVKSIVTEGKFCKLHVLLVQKLS